MFSGIAETAGVIRHVEYSQNCLTVIIAPMLPFLDIKIGDSIAVNGVCLTVTAFTNENFTVTIVPETSRLTNLNEMVIGSLVNLERSLKVGDRIGGHYVQGHVDEVGEVASLSHDGDAALLLTIKIPTRLQRYIVPKGYVAIDGMSITVIDAQDDWFSITLIPHTQEVSIANQYKVGTKVNIEVDILSKYIEKIVGAKA
tara:strand:- start:1654 stop:2250 length:597 start_codon:yes stop_codon:yes gene_type:complete